MRFFWDLVIRNVVERVNHANNGWSVFCTTPFLPMQSNKFRFETTRQRTNELAINFNKILTECSSSSCKQSDTVERERMQERREEEEKKNNGHDMNLVPLELMIRIFFEISFALHFSLNQRAVFLHCDILFGLQ